MVIIKCQLGVDLGEPFKTHLKVVATGVANETITINLKEPQQKHSTKTSHMKNLTATNDQKKQSKKSKQKQSAET